MASERLSNKYLCDDSIGFRLNAQLELRAETKYAQLEICTNVQLLRGSENPDFGSENSKPPWTQLSLSRIIKVSNFAQDLDQ